MAHGGPVQYALLYINNPPGLSSSLLLGFLGSTIPASDFSLCMRGRILWPQSGSCHTWRNLVTCFKEFRLCQATWPFLIPADWKTEIGTQPQHICYVLTDLSWFESAQLPAGARNQHTCTMFSELNSLLLLFHLCGKGERKWEQGLGHATLITSPGFQCGLVVNGQVPRSLL